jgi:hypothetical protein
VAATGAGTGSAGPGSSVSARKPLRNWKPAFLKAFAETGIVLTACRAARISRQQAYKVRASNPKFAAAWAEAEEGATELLEAEARRRAYTGTQKPIYQNGHKVGQVREYSDVLLIFLLKAHRPSIYRENARLELTGANGGPIATSQVLEGLNDHERAALRRAIDAALDQQSEPAEDQA